MAEFKPKIYMSRAVKARLDFLSCTSEITTEVAALLTGKTVKDGVFIDGFIIPEQKVSVGSVNIDAKAFTKVIQEFPDASKRIIGHWHKHPGTSKPSPSMTDENQTFNIISVEEDRPVLVYLISSGNYNKTEGLYYTRMNVYINGMTMSLNPDLEVGDLTEADIDELMLEIKEKVSPLASSQKQLSNNSNINKGNVNKMASKYFEPDKSSYPYLETAYGEWGCVDIVFGKNMKAKSQKIFEDIKMIEQCRSIESKTDDHEIIITCNNNEGVNNGFYDKIFNVVKNYYKMTEKDYDMRLAPGVQEALEEEEGDTINNDNTTPYYTKGKKVWIESLTQTDGIGISSTSKNAKKLKRVADKFKYEGYVVDTLISKKDLFITIERPATQAMKDLMEDVKQAVKGVGL